MVINSVSNGNITINLNTDGTWAIFAGSSQQPAPVENPNGGTVTQRTERETPKCLDDMTWSEIKSLGSKASEILRFGDYKNATLKDGTVVQFRIIGFNHDVTASGQKVPTSWEMVDCLPTAYPWNETDTNHGSWAATKIRRQLNEADGDIHRLIPDDICSVVTPVIKETADSNGTIIRTEDSFWLKSEKEQFGRNIYSCPGEGHWYEYYRQEGVPYWKKRNGDSCWTMLRSPFSGDSSYFCFVLSDGFADSDFASYSIGVAFGFCV